MNTTANTNFQLLHSLQYSHCDEAVLQRKAVGVQQQQQQQQQQRNAQNQLGKVQLPVAAGSP